MLLHTLFGQLELEVFPLIFCFFLTIYILYIYIYPILILQLEKGIIQSVLLIISFILLMSQCQLLMGP